MNTVSRKGGHAFSRVPSINIPRSRFDLSHGHKTTLDGGFLYPVFLNEALPGDSWKLTATQLCRMTTPLVPFMDNVRATWFFFSVPKRLLWDNFEDYITGAHKGKLGTTHTEIPQLTINRALWDSDPIFDHFGIPRPAAGGSFSVSALPFRAYLQIYNEWFRDENLIEPIELDLGDNDSANTSLYKLRKRCKRHDYVTSCLPFVQKGPDVSLPLGSAAPLVAGASSVPSTLAGKPFSFVGTSSSPYPSIVRINGTALTGGQAVVPEVDLSEATAATINSLREAFAVQHLFERDARGGSRMTELLESHFSVRAPDFRLQRPEYLGGGNIDFLVNSIAQTSSSASTPQGNLAATAKSVGSIGFQASFVEPCYVIGLVAITCDLFYQSALNKLWTKKTRTDEYWPEFAHLGEQAVLEHEVFADGTDTDKRVFGYQERYAEYRYGQNLITGKLRSSASGTLDCWHLAQDFANAPSLSKEFIEENPPFARVLAVQNEPQFVLDAWFDLKAFRPLPTYSVPSLLDHF